MLPKDNIVIAVGDLNAMMGSGSTLREHVMMEGRTVFAHCSSAESAVRSVSFQLTHTVRTVRLTTMRSAVNLGISSGCT